MSVNTLYVDFITPENNGKKIGLFRFVFSLFGGLLISYLAMILLAVLLPTTKAQSLVVSLFLYTFVWSCCILWISLSISKFIVFLKVFISSSILSILIIILN